MLLLGIPWALLPNGSNAFKTDSLGLGEYFEGFLSPHTQL